MALIKMHVVCPRCDAVNRLPAERVEDRPTCGRCKTLLFTGMPLTLTAKNFRRHIDRNNIPLLVDFWAPWCAPCVAMAPAYEQACRQLEPRMRVAKLNTEDESPLATQLLIRSIPTLVLFNDGRELDRHSGALSAKDIVQWARAMIP